MSDAFAHRLRALADWRPPEAWPTIRVIDAHTAGEPLRIIVGGWPDLAGTTILDRRRLAKGKWDRLRKALMWEPRGHADMYGCLVMPPATEDGHFGVLFLHNEGFSTMCGHGIIAIAKVAVETGLVPRTGAITEVRIDAPAGRVTAFAECAGSGCGDAPDGGDGPATINRVRFRNVPSYVALFDREIDVPGLGPVRYDLAFGGAFYAFVDAESVGVGLGPEDFRDLIDKGMAIKRAVMAAGPIEHPEDHDLGYLYGTIFTGPAHTDGVHSRNVCIFAEGEVDRSPTGTGVSARLAIHHARGEIAVGETIEIESILGTRFTGRIAGETTCGPYPAVIPEVGGRAHVCGAGTWVIDPEDPLGHGFILR